jgi:hypothetical protein
VYQTWLVACFHGVLEACRRVAESKVLITVPLRALLDQFASDFPGFCKVGTGHNERINFDAKRFLAVTDSVHLLKKLKFDAIFVDEAHHPFPLGLPQCADLYLLSATQKQQPDFRYTMGQAIQDGVLCDYDITVPAVSEHHPYVCLAGLLLKQAGHFRRVLAYCNSIAEAKRFRMVLKELGLAAWHVNSKTPLHKRTSVIEEFAGPLLKPVHVLVTVEVLGEGINIPNADTCMFVEPRNSYRSVIQAIGRVLRRHPAKTLAHIVLPAVAVPKHILQENEERRPQEMLQTYSKNETQSLQGSSTPASLPEGQGQPTRTQRVRNWRAQFKPCRNIQSGAKNGLQLEQPGDHIPFRRAHACQQSQVQSYKSSHTSAPDLDDRVDRVDRVVAGSTRNIHSASSALSFPDDPQLAGTRYGETGQYDVNLVHTQDAESGSLPSRHGPNPGDVLAKDESPKQQTVAKGAESSGNCGGELKAAEGGGLATIADSQPGRSLNQSKKSLQLELMSLEEVPDFRTRGGASPRISGEIPLRARLRPSIFGLQENYDSQVERFMAMLVQADDRLVGATASYRIHIVDCSLNGEGTVEFDTTSVNILARLSAILSQTDPWEIHLGRLEDFCDRYDRLPKKTSKDSLDEKRLGTWLGNQNVMLKQNRLPLQRLNRLLNSTFLPIRDRVKGWVVGDRDGAFQKRCVGLELYIATHGTLPPRSHPLGRWIERQRMAGLNRDPLRRTMLLSVHPIVRDLLNRWEQKPLQIKVKTWEKRLHEVNTFVVRFGRLPGQDESGKAERYMYGWLHCQRQRLRFGVLPLRLAHEFRSCHPLIVAATKQADQKGRKNRFHTGFSFQLSSLSER